MEIRKFSSCVETYFTRFLHSLAKYLPTLKEKFRIFTWPCNILYFMCIIRNFKRISHGLYWESKWPKQLRPISPSYLTVIIERKPSLHPGFEKNFRWNHTTISMPNTGFSNFTIKIILPTPNGSTAESDQLTVYYHFTKIVLFLIQRVKQFCNKA